MTNNKARVLTRHNFMLVFFNQDALSEFHRLVRITQLLNQLQLQITKKTKKKTS